MNTTLAPRMGTWSPAPHRPLPSPYRTRIGQATAPAEPRKPNPFFDSPLLALVTDASAAGMSAYLAWGLGKAGNTWSTFFWVLSAAMGMKALHDLSRVK